MFAKRFLYTAVIGLSLVSTLAVSASAWAQSTTLNFRDDFESGSWAPGSGGFRWTNRSNNVFVDRDPKTGAHTIPYEGNYSMGFAHRAKPDGSDSTAEQRFALSTPVREIWIDFRVRIPDNFYHRDQESSTNSKWLALWTDVYERSGLTVVLEYWPTGDGGAKLAYRWVKDNVRVGHMGHQEIIRVPGNRGQWLKFRSHIVLASGPNTNDGVIETWMSRSPTGELVRIHERTGTSLYSSNGDQKFVAGYLMGWSNSGFDEETTFYIDNFEISGDATLGSSPRPPTDISVN